MRFTSLVTPMVMLLAAMPFIGAEQPPAPDSGNSLAFAESFNSTSVLLASASASAPLPDSPLARRADPKRKPAAKKGVAKKKQPAPKRKPANKKAVTKKGAPKRKPARKAPGKNAVTKKKAAPKRKASPKKAVGKKAAPKRKPARKPVTKSAVAKKKAAPKRKPAAPKKAAPKRKPAAPKKAAPKRKPAAPKKAAPKRKPAAPKKAAPKPKPLPQRQPTHQQMCNKATQSDIENVPGYQNLLNYVKKTYGNWDRMYVNWNEPGIPNLGAETCTTGELVKTYWEKPQCSPVTQSCTGGCGNDGTTNGDSIDIQTITQGLFSVSTSVQTDVKVGVGYTYTFKAAVPVVGGPESTHAVTATLDVTNSRGSTKTSTVMGQVSQTVHKTIPPKGCGYRVTNTVCNSRGSAEINFAVNGWVWFTFGKKVRGHYYWAVNIADRMGKGKNIARTQISMAANANSATKIEQVCGKRRREMSPLEFLAAAEEVSPAVITHASQPTADTLVRRDAAPEETNHHAKRGIYPTNIGYTVIDGVRVAYAD
ncbi:hypothetical protein DFJ77DRAFT_15917 [Powellomyces hirtus]|nr:hypothetical protein DFJ77DRAFT_15917 [Powellomyces hirtus]